MKIMKTSSITVMFLLLILGLIVGNSYAQNDDGIEEEARILAPTKNKFKKPVKIVVVTEPTLRTTTSGAFVDIPSASATVTFSKPRGIRAVLSSWCSVGGAGAEEDLVVRVLVDSTPLFPGNITFGEDFGDDTVTPTWSCMGVWYTNGKLAPGTYTVKAQWRTDSGAKGMFSQSSFTVELLK